MKEVVLSDVLQERERGKEEMRMREVVFSVVDRKERTNQYQSRVSWQPQ